MDLKRVIREVPDFTKAGIGFKDITTLLKDGDAFRESVNAMQAAFADAGATKVVGIEPRGFMFAAVLAYNWGVGFVPIRKHGKLPAATLRESYSLEYGSDHLEIHVDACEPGERVLVVDDLLATGGTAIAATTLLRKAGATVERAAFVIDLPDLGGSRKLAAEAVAVHRLMEFEGD